jgi:hypothetical protein
MKRRARAATVCTAVTILAGLAAGNADARGTQVVGETYADYTLMFQKSAAQIWNKDNSSAVSQWAWSPQPQLGEHSYIYWGNPYDWSKATYEDFYHDGDWVRLSGYGGGPSGSYKQDVAVQWTADTDCKTNRQALPAGDQYYAKWSVTGVGYCLFASGTITQQSTGKQVAFVHQQVWTKEPCDNPNIGMGPRDCLKQQEVWWDDNLSPWSKKVDHVQYVGKGIGPAYNMTGPDGSMRYSWSWG